MAAQSPLDTRLASLGLLLGAGMIGYSYFRSKQGVGPLTGGGTPNTPTGESGSSTAPAASSTNRTEASGWKGIPYSLPKPANAGTPLKQLLDWAQQNSLLVTSSYRSPEHNREIGGAPNSLHTFGRAIDVSTRGLSHDQLNNLIRDAQSKGWVAVFEAAFERYSTGPHLHVAIPFKKFGAFK